MANEKALAKPGETAFDIIKRGYEKLQDKDLSIVRAMSRFCELPSVAEDPDDTTVKSLLALPIELLQAQGWKSHKELRMASYGRLPRSRWPASMQAAHERVGMRLRKRSESDAPPTFQLNMITIPAPRAAEEGKIITIEANRKD